MAKASRLAKLETRTSRSKLKPQHEPYWAAIGKGLYLGYRKGTSGGSWLARVYIHGKYKKQKLGKADDFQDSDNLSILDYFEAQGLARLASKKLYQTTHLNTDNIITITDAIQSYLNWYKLNKKAYKSTLQAVNAHILPILGKFKLAELSTQQIRFWHENLAKQAARTRSKTQAINLNADVDSDTLRKRKATANRILTILKAALNHAWQDGHIASDEAWRKVKPFKNVDQPKIRFLSLPECTRLTNASDRDFRPLIRAALLTGCRYGELINLKAADFNKNTKTIHLLETKNDKRSNCKQDTRC